MSAALLILAYAVLVAWWVPSLLGRLTVGGLSARLGLAAWLAAMASVLISAEAVVLFLVKAAIAGWPGLAEAVCRSVTGHACAVAVYTSAAFELCVSLVAVLAVSAAAMVAWRYGRRVQRTHRQTRAHAQAAPIVGRRLPGISPGGDPAVVLDDPRPAAYCVPGRPATIVLTSGALAVLDSPQLAAVLAHERAHLAGRHHLVLTLTRGLAATLPAVPVFARGATEVARLAEMSADDAAARRSGRPTLLAALLTMGTGQAVPASALAVTGGAVTARVQRLIEPPRYGRQARNKVALVAVTGLLIAATATVMVFAGPLASYALTLHL
ncbi:MAG TPA: M56 family metallopeptidase [Streptosporangiaceae bacterium]|jgi:Zn-dependent protease with chaperone function|nr:M56 family metallopeptidase [Streptosporangiaceae bacterium]